MKKTNLYFYFLSYLLAAKIKSHQITLTIPLNFLLIRWLIILYKYKTDFEIFLIWMDNFWEIQLDFL
jgi:hypothetical protein